MLVSGLLSLSINVLFPIFIIMSLTIFSGIFWSKYSPFSLVVKVSTSLQRVVVLWFLTRFSWFITFSGLIFSSHLDFTLAISSSNVLIVFGSPNCINLHQRSCCSNVEHCFWFFKCHVYCLGSILISLLYYKLLDVFSQSFCFCNYLKIKFLS